MRNATTTIGVLALQGAFSKHVSALQSLQVNVRTVRTPQELAGCDGLILPGGESTAMVYHIDKMGLRDSLAQFAREKPVFGTCAGLILLAKNIVDKSIPSLEILDVAVQRNGFGRQIDSFSTSIEIKCNRRAQPFQSIFIRAPRITQCGEGVKVLAEMEGEPVLVQQDHCLAATFHPELTKNPLIHKYFVDIVRDHKDNKI